MSADKREREVGKAEERAFTRGPGGWGVCLWVGHHVSEVGRAGWGWRVGPAFQNKPRVEERGGWGGL